MLMVRHKLKFRFGGRFKYHSHILQPQTPTKLLEDLTEITKKDNCDTSHANSNISFQSDFSSHHDSGIGGANGGGAAAAVNKENASPNKKSGPLARKSLNASEAWGASTSATAAASGNVLSRGSEASFANPGEFQNWSLDRDITKGALLRR